MKDTFEVVLDGRQVRQVLLGGLVALVAVFAAGYFVGQELRAAPLPVETGSVDPLATLDERAQKLEEVRADAALTFQDELTRQRPPEAFAAEPARVVIQPAPGAPPTDLLPAAQANRPAEIPDPPAPPPARREPPRAPPPARAALEDKPASPAVPTRTASGESALRDAFARATQQPRGIPETSPNGAFTLQLAASPSRAEADRFAANLRDKGYAPYIVEAHADGKGTFYRVRMGRFPSKEAAQRYLGDFKRETQLNAFVAPAN